MNSDVIYLRGIIPLRVATAVKNTDTKRPVTRPFLFPIDSRNVATIQHAAKLGCTKGVIANVRVRFAFLVCLILSALHSPLGAQIPQHDEKLQSPGFTFSYRDQSLGTQGPEMGSVTDNIYTNSYFGFTYEFPKGWTVPNEETRKYLREMTRAAASGGDPAKAAVFDVAVKRTHQLLTVLEHPMGTPGASETSITVMSEDISYAPGVQKPTDYLLNTKAGFVKRQPDLKVQLEPTDVILRGKPFARMNVSFERSTGETVYMGYAATILNSQIILFVFNCNKLEQRVVLMDTLNTLQFNPELISTVALINQQMISIPQVLTVNSIGKANFQPYLFQLIKVVKEKWYANMPREAINGPKGKVIVEFGIKKGGTLSEKPRVEQGSGHNTLDDATVNAVRLAAPFDPLPADYKSKEVRLRMVFLYNLPFESVLNK